MVAYVSGNSLGWINGSAGVLGNAGQVGNAGTGNTGENILVNAATGNLIISHRDEYLSGLGLDLPILRTYNSQGLLNDDNGDNWRLGYSRTISALTGAANTPFSTVTRTYEDGAAIVYTYDTASGQYISDAGAGARDTLSYNAGADTWTWTDGDTQTTERYAGIISGGQLQSITDHNGNTVTLSWNGNLLTRITNADNEYVSFIYDTTAGHTANLVQVSTYAKTNPSDANAILQTRVSYSYDGSNRLTSVTVDLTPANTTDASVYTTSYTYVGASRQIASVTQTDGNQLQFIYDGSGRISQINDVRSVSDTRTTTFDYSIAGQTTITNAANTPLAQSVTMKYDATTGQLKTLTQPGIGDTIYTYDANGNVIQVTDPKGNVTVYGYDGQDNRVYERDAAGNTISRTYSSTNQLLSETRYRAPDPDGSGSQTASLPETTRYVYDANGNLRFTVSPEGRVTEYRYDSHGLLLNQISYTGNTFDIDAALATSSQDFSVDTSGLTIPAAATSGGYFTQSNGALNVTRQLSATSVSYVATGSTYQALGATFSADVTTDANASQRFFLIGTQNGGSSATLRQMAAYFSGSNLYAYYRNVDGTPASTLLLSSVKDNTAYTVEVVTGASGSTLYVYEKGKTRADGMTYTQTVAGWDQAKWMLRVDSSSTVASTSTMVVDNLRTTGQTSTQNFAVDTSGLTIAAADQTSGYFNVQGSLNVARRYADTAASYNIYGSTNYTPGTGFHAEIVTDASTNRYFMIGAQNGGSGATSRRMMAYFSGNDLYANYLDSNGNSASTLLLSNVKANTNYVVEVDTSSTGATLYVFEKGKTRADGVSYSQTVDGWTQARWMITTQNSNTVTSPSTIAVDLLSTSTGDSQDFSIDTTGLTISSTLQAQGIFALNKTFNAVSQNGASVTTHRVFGSSYQAIGTEFQADVIVDASTQRYALVGIDNGQTSGVGARRMAAYFNGNVIYANYFDATGANISTRIGTVQANTEYLVEVQTSADGATLYVYPKGQARAAGMSFTQTIDGWSQARWFIQTKSDPALPAGAPTTLAINSLSTSVPATGLTEVALSNWAGQQDQAQTQRIDTSYDFRGQVSKVSRYATINTDGTTAGQTDTLFVYDAWGELVQTIDARGVASATANDYLTTYTYDGLGRMLTRQQNDANGTALTLSSTAYNDPLRQSTVTLKNLATGALVGPTTLTTYDQAGRPVYVRQTDSGTGTEVSRTDYVVDVLGRTVAKRVTTSTAGSPLSSYAIYDASNRKVADIDATGALTEYIYNADSQVVETIAYANLLDVTSLAGRDPTAFTLSGANGLRPVATANDRLTRSLYDAAGRLVKTIDPDGAVIQYQYDGRGQLIQTTAYANRVTATQISALAATNGDIAPTDANTIAVTDAANDRTTRSFYSDDGLLLGTLDAEGYLTEYRYDGAGQRVQSIQYATATNASLRITATDLGQLRPLANASDITTTVLYNDEGQVTGQIDGEGYLTETQYDAAGNVAATIRYANQVTTTSVIGAIVASVRPATSSADHRVISQYDAFNRIVQTQSLPDNLVTTYQYDAAGNLISVTASPGANQRQDLKRYDALGRVTSELSGENAARITNGMTQAQIDAIWAGYATKYTYDESGVLASTTDGLGRKTLYYYDNDGRLAYTINAMGEVSLTKYDAFGGKTEFWRYQARLTSNLLSGLTGGFAPASLLSTLATLDNSGIVKTSQTYTLRGQIANAFDAYNTNIEQRHYNAFGELDQDSLLIAAAGPMRVDTFAYDQLGNLVTEQDDVNVANATTTKVYDAFGRLTQSTGPTGIVTNASYDRLGRTVTTSIGSGTTIASKTIAYDAFGRTLSLINSDGATTYTYDDVNRKLTVTTPLGIATSQTHDEFGETIAVTDGRGNVTSYTYNDDGQVTLVTDPAGNTATTYDPAGQVIQTTDRNGIVTTYTYDAAGRVLTATLDPTGLNITTRTCYDALGEAIWHQDVNGIWTKTDYDLNGRVATVSVDPAQVPNQAQLPGALVLIANPNASPLNLQTTYTYDPAGDVLTVTEGSGSKTTQYTYDNLRRRTKEVVDPSGLAITTQYSYDDAGNVVQKIDANGNKSYYGYDVYGRQTVTVDAAGSVTQMVYDSLNRVVQVKQYKDALNAASLATLPAIASNGTRKDADVLALLPSGAANTNYLVTQTIYNADGQKQYVIDAAGDVTKYDYDASGNVVMQTRYANTVTPGTGINGLVADVTRDRVTRYVYDGASRLVWTIDAAGYATRNSYDGDGNVVRNRAFSTALTASQLATLSVNSSASDVGGMIVYANNDRITRTVYDAAGRVMYAIDAAGGVTYTAYDKTGNALSSTAYATALTSAQLSALTNGVIQPSEVTAVLSTSANDRVMRNAYDAAGRLTYTMNALGGITRLEYDACGRVVRKTAYENLATDPTSSNIAAQVTLNSAKDRVERYVYDADGRKVATIDAAGGVVRKQYDALGNVVSTTAYVNAVTPSNLSSLPLVMSWNDIGTRLTVDPVNDSTTRYAFDALGRATYVMDAVGAISYTQYDALGNVVKSTAYANKAANISSSDPASQVVADPVNDQVERYAYDATGRKIATVDAVGAVKYTQYDGLGNAVSTTVYANTINASGLPPAPAWSNISSLLTADPANDCVTHRTFDKAGNLIEEISGFGNAVAATGRYAYNAFGDQVSITDPRGVELAEQDSTWALTRRKLLGYVDASGNAKLAAALTAADKASLIARYTTTQQFDALGRKTASIDPLGGTTTTVYDTAGNAVQVTDPLGNSGYFYFDKLNRVVLQIDPNGFVIQTQYGSNGKPSKTTQYVNPVSGTATASAAPVVLASAPTPAPSYPYVVSNAAKDQVTTFDYDLTGRLLKTTDAENYYDSYTYDALGNRTTLRNKAGGVMQYTYDAVGNLVTETLPVASRDSSGNIIATSIINKYVYDAFGNRIKTIEAFGLPEQRTTTFKFDAANRQITKTGETLPVFDPVSQTTGSATPAETQKYDARGNIIEKVDANGSRSLTYYDALNRKIAEVSPTGTLTTYSYNDGKVAISSRVYGDSVALPATAGGSVPTPVVPANMRETFYDYDANYRLTATTIKAVTIGSYNANTSKYELSVGDLVTRQVYDADGNTIQSIDANGNATTFFYDKMGQKILQVDAGGYGTSWTYDLNGHALRQRQFATAYPTLVTTSSNAATLLANWPTSSNDRITDYTYDRNGRVLTESRLNVVYATVNGATVSTLTGSATTAYAYNGLGNVVRQTNAKGDVTDFTYDYIGRKTQEKDAAFTASSGATVRATTDYEYDGLNDVVRTLARGSNDTVETDDEITRYVYGTGGRLTQQIDPAGTTTFEYDAAANITRKSRARLDADGASTTDRTIYRYDGMNREIEHVDISTNVSQQTRYDAYGEIVAKGTNNGWQEFSEYDKAGRLFRGNASTGVTKAYIYDAAGNSTLTIESDGTDLATMTLDQMLGASTGIFDPNSRNSAYVHLTVSVFDQRNQLTDTYQPEIDAANQSASVGSSTNAVQLPSGTYSGTSAAPGSSSATVTVAPTNPVLNGTQAISGNNFTITGSLACPVYYQGSATAMWNQGVVTLPSSLSSWGAGSIEVLVEPYDANTGAVVNAGPPIYPPAGATSVSIPSQFLGINSTNSGPKYGLRIRVLKTITNTSQQITLLDNKRGPGSDFNAAVTSAVPKLLLFKDMASSVNRIMLWYKPQGSTAPYTLGTVSAYSAPSLNSTISIANWYTWDWTSIARGTYDVKYVSLDSAGNIKDQATTTVTLSDTAPSLTAPAANSYGPSSANSYVFQSGSVLNLTGQGTNATTMVVSYRQAGVNPPPAWTAVSPALTSASVGGVTTPGWFKWNYSALAAGNYEVIFESRTSTGATINKIYSSVHLDSTAPKLLSGLTLYQNRASTITFTGNPANATNLKVSYRTTGSTGTYTVVNLPPTAAGSGTFYWDASLLVPYEQTNFSYEFIYQATNSVGQVVNSGKGSLQLGTSPQFSQTPDVRIPVLTFMPPPDGSQNAVYANATQMAMYYRVRNSNGDFTVGPVVTESADGNFYWDVTALKPASGSTDYEYYFNLLDANGNKLKRTSGYFTVGTTSSANELTWAVSGVTGPNVIHRHQRTNAFGEIDQETDGRNNTTDYAYNTLGKVAQQLSPTTNATLANGFIKTGIRPETDTYYDLLGQVVGVKDANGNVNTQAWLAGNAQKVTDEWHADGGHKSYGYDIFGNQRYVIDENIHRTDYTYDKANRLIRVDHAQRLAGTPGSDQINAARTFDTYEYDANGNRIAHTNSLGYREKTYYDSLGRVTKTVGNEGHITTYAYTYVSTILGVGGKAVGGFKKVTTDDNAQNNVMIDKTDVFGHLTWHQDLGGHTFTYNYNSAGWLASQTGSSGQNISYNYFYNGYIKDIIDNAAHTRTSYEYDAEGNKTFEGYVTLNADNVTVKDYYQQSRVTYDALNRVTQIDDPRATVVYEYDAAGNRRHVKSTYHDGLNGNLSTQDYWYRYDQMNRFTVSMGALSGGVRGASATDNTVTITRGSSGFDLAYDLVGQRVQATDYDQNGAAHQDTYIYTADGYLEDTKIDGVLTYRRVNDELGRVKVYYQYQNAAFGTAANTRSMAYNGDNLVTSQTDTASGTTTYYYLNDGTLNYTYNVSGTGTNTYTYYRYDWWDSGKQNAITLSPVNTNAPNWQSSTSTLSYDVNGHLTGATDTTGGRVISYVTDAQGLVLQRDEIVYSTVEKIHNYYYLDSHRVGDVGNDGAKRVDYALELAQSKNVDHRTAYYDFKPIASADYDQNYEPVNSTYPGNAAGSYVVQQGDTLQSIAALQWGDSSLWYILADANGLTGSETLKAGTRLVVPNKITNIHNNSGTFKVYNAGEAIGDTSPTMMAPPPPPPAAGGGGGCGGLAMIIIIVVAVVVTVYTAGALSGATANLWTAGMNVLAGTGAGAAGLGTVGTAMVAGAVGSIASQAVGIALGVQDDFSWSAVAMSAVGAGVGAGMGEVIKGGTLAATVERAVAGNVITQGVALATGLQQKFDWRGVAVSAVGSAISYGMGDLTKNMTKNQYVNSFVKDMASGMINGGVRSMIYGEEPDWGGIATQSFGNALANTIVEGLKDSNEPLTAKRRAELYAKNQEAADSIDALAKAEYGGDKNKIPTSRLQEAINQGKETGKAIYGDIKNRTKDDPVFSNFEDNVKSTNDKSPTVPADAASDPTTVVVEGKTDLLHAAAKWTAVGTGVVTGVFQSVGDMTIGVGQLIFDALKAQQYVLGGGLAIDTFIGPRNDVETKVQREAFENIVGTVRSLTAIAQHPIEFAKSALSDTFDQMNRSLQAAEASDELGDWFLYGASVGHGLMNIALVIDGGVGAARSIAGLRGVVGAAARNIGTKSLDSLMKIDWGGAPKAVGRISDDAAAVNPGRAAAESANVTRESLLRALRKANTPESLATAKLISKGKMDVNIRPTDPSGRGLGGLYRFGTRQIEIYEDASSTVEEAAGYATHETTHYMQGLSSSTYNLGHEFDAFRAQGAADPGHWSNSLSDNDLYDFIQSHPVYRGIKPDPTWPRN